MADNKKEVKDKPKVKRPTAQKRVLQNDKARLRNRTFKSQVRSAVRQLDEKISSGEKEASETALNTVYSFMDKGVKRGIFKVNKASRSKSRFSARFASKFAG